MINKQTSMTAVHESTDTVKYITVT